MLRAILLVGIVAFGNLGLMGCYGGREPTATKPQAENQKPKTQEERIDYLIAMLHRKQSPKKNAQAAQALARIGAASARAIPDLEQVMTNHENPEVQRAAQAAIAEIQTAKSMEE